MNKNKVADERQQKKIINNLNSATSSNRVWLRVDSLRIAVIS